MVLGCLWSHRRPFCGAGTAPEGVGADSLLRTCGWVGWRSELTAESPARSCCLVRFPLKQACGAR